MAGWLQAAVVIAVVAVLHVPLGDYMARTLGSGRHWRAEMVLYRCCGIDPDADQRWPDYLRSLLAVSLVGVLGLYLLLRAQPGLPYSLGHPGMNPALAFDTAVSFTTNTNWQNYSGEAALGYLAQAAGLGAEAFLSAAVGLAAALALIRGLVRRETDRVGNFWVDLTRSVIRLLLPLALVAGLVLAGLGVIQSMGGWHLVTTVAGGRQAIPGGPVASWEPIKLISGDGGGFSADGAADASYDSFTSLGGGMLLSAMMLGEISPGGVGSGLYGLLMVVLIAVFLGGLMISRTPEFLRKRIRAPEMRMIALYYLATPIALLAGAGLAIALPAGRASILNPGAHGLSEVVYGLTSAANSNGSAFGGLSGNTTFYNVTLAVVMLLGRYLPMVFVLGLAGCLAQQKPVAVTPGTLRTHTPTFVALTFGVALVLVFLTFLPALSLGPLAEGLH